jgi:hypothetical protein
VLYVPSAVDLTRGGFFQRRGEDGTFDTLISAQHILKSMADSHAAQLAALSLQLPESRALLQTRAASDALALGASGSSGSDASLAGSSPGSVTAGAPKQASKGKQGGGKGRAASAEGSLMQLVVAGLSTDEHVSAACCWVRACLCVCGGGCGGGMLSMVGNHPCARHPLQRHRLAPACRVLMPAGQAGG